MNPVQRESIRKLQRIAEVTGASITVQDMGSGRRLSGKNGYYNPADGSIHIDLRAGSNGTGTLLYTAGHEFVHRMRQNNPEGFQRLSDFLLSEYGKQGVRTNDLVKKQMVKANAAGIRLSYSEALEEVVADAMEVMFTDTDALAKMQKLKQHDRTLWQQLKDFIQNLADRLRTAYRHLKPDSEEARHVLEMQSSIDRMAQLFAEGVMTQESNNTVLHEEGNVRYSVRDNVLTAESTEAERFELLKNAEISLTEVDQHIIQKVDLESFNTRKKSAVIPGFKALANQLGIMNVDLMNSRISFPFKLSGRNLEKSLHHQLEYGGTYQDYVKAMSCFTDLVKNAIPIEVHPEKKVGTTKANPDLLQTYVLISAYKDGPNIVPVQLEVKEFRQRGNSLYMSVVLTKIDLEVMDTGVPGETGNMPHLFSRSSVSLRQLFENVNAKDGRFLKYVPDAFLNTAQKAAKQNALRKQREEYSLYHIPMDASRD